LQNSSNAGNGRTTGISWCKRIVVNVVRKYVLGGISAGPSRAFHAQAVGAFQNISEQGSEVLTVSALLMYG
jgi:hypothetical protein